MMLITTLELLPYVAKLVEGKCTYNSPRFEWRQSVINLRRPLPPIPGGFADKISDHDFQDSRLYQFAVFVIFH